MNEEKSQSMDLTNHKTEHIDHAREERAVLDFYNEHSHFMYMLFSQCGDSADFSVELPRCYFFGCPYRYKLYDLKQIAARINCHAIFEQDLKVMSEYIQELPEECQEEWKKKVSELKKSCVIENDISNYSVDFALVRISAFAYLHEIINTRKDKIETLNSIQRNAKEKLSIDIQDSIKALKKIVKSPDIERRLKSFVMRNNSFIKLLKMLVAKHKYVQELATNKFPSVEFIFDVMEYFAAELRVSVHLFCKALHLNSKNEGKIVPKYKSQEVFPNLHNDEIYIMINYNAGSSTDIIVVFSRNPDAQRIGCNHFVEYSAENAPGFLYSDSIARHRFCPLCWLNISKRELIEANRNMCVECLGNFALEESVVQLQCRHKLCVRCYEKTPGKCDGEVYCTVCQRTSMS
eukprot:TRINITY_DN10990_c0_g1_i6.p1 TRINITY_DN10990_c0_g1~~TRINITY_DN10990_c0_g1_i6.p1  ORF type:complete len:405 (+),score=102.58 TRINITY_DN10990_c0_g1_i6:138-1352(+)